MPDLEVQKVIIHLLVMFTFSLSSSSYQNHVIIQGVIKFVMECPSEGFPKAIEQTIPNIPSGFHLRDPIQMFNINLIQFTL